jgi:hypothetical protein
VAVRFWLNPQGGQHPDIRWRREATLRPGRSLKPDVPVYTILIGGPGGLEGWEACNRGWSRHLNQPLNQ